MMTTETDTDPRVWIGCLACYNAGRLVGEWVDAVDAGDTTPEDIHRDMLNAGRAVVERRPLIDVADVYVTEDGPSPHEELWVMDHEGFMGALSGECSPVEAQKIAEILADLEDHEREAFAAWWGNENRGELDADAVDTFRDSLMGIWDSAEDYARGFAEDTGALIAIRETGPYGQTGRVDMSDVWPFTHIDWEGATRDLMMDYTVLSVSDGVAIFSDH